MSSAARVGSPSIDELQVGRVYAKALWNLAVEREMAEALIEEYRSLVADVLDREPELEVFFSLGSLGQERRAEMLEHIFAGRASELLYDFLRTLNRHDRLGVLRAVGILLDEMWERSRGMVPVIVRTAKPLPTEQVETVRSMVAKRFGIKPDLKLETDPTLLGGLWLRVGDTVYDRSVRSNLVRLRDNILKRSSHEIQSGRDILDRSAGN